MSRIPSLARLRALRPAERRLLARALVLMPIYAIGVRLVGLRGASQWFGRMPPIEGATAVDAARLVAAVARRAPGNRGCLPAALTLQRLLAAQGLASELRIGVRKSGSQLEAHAWLERGGAPILDTHGEPGNFAVLEPAARGR